MVELSGNEVRMTDKTRSESQRWTMKDGSLINLNGEKKIDIDGSKIIVKSGATQRKKRSAANPTWEIGNGVVKHVPSNKVLTSGQGTLYVAPSTGAANQAFKAKTDGVPNCPELQWEPFSKGCLLYTSPSPRDS